MFDFPGGEVAAFCAAFAVGSAGYFLFKFLRIPLPALLGAMASTGALNAAGFFPSFDTSLVSLAANVTIGIAIGRQINKTTISSIARMFKPVLIQTAGLLILSLACGFSMYLMKGASLTTSLISGAAGGIAEMIIFGMSMNADITVIALVQLFRIVIFLAMIPYLAIITEKITGASRAPRGGNDRAADASVKFFERKTYPIMIILAFTVGALASWMKIPIGDMLGAMLTAGGIAVYLGRQYKFDEKLRLVAQIGLGLVTGERITPQIIAQLRLLFVPALVVTLVMLVGCVLMAILLYKTSEWDLTTCLLCAAPAGLSQIVSLAEDVGVDPIVASVFHTARIVGIVSLYPWLVLPFASI